MSLKVTIYITFYHEYSMSTMIYVSELHIKVLITLTILVIILGGYGFARS